MEINEIIELSSDFGTLKNKITNEAAKKVTNVAGYLKEYEPAYHKSMDTTMRPDKIITTDQGPSTVPVTRLALPLQKKIVAMAAAFLCGNPIKLNCTPVTEEEKKMLEVIERTWESNKLDYQSKTIAKILFSETEVAEIWYRDAADPTYWANTVNQNRPHRLRMKVVANSLGDSLYPVFNKMGDMIAFGREYSIKVNGKNEPHLDIYTDTTTYLGKNTGNAWEMSEEKNLFGKIPVIYYSQPAPEWADVQSLIDRLEKALSNHGDTNDYFSSPMVKVKGEIKGFASKGESGKVIELTDGAEADYMSWDQSPKSQELEFKNLRSLIFDMTDTPDISIEQMKSLGTYSGIALKMLFLSAHLKAADKEENFGVCIQRRINFIKAAMTIINVDLGKASSLVISPRFEYFLPKDDAGLIDMLFTATGSKPIMSQESAVKHNPLITDHEKEIAKVKEETTVDSITPIA